RKLSEQALVKEKEAAQAATIAKSQFLAMMSHEIRTPLNSVLGFAEMLSKSELTPAQREHLDLIRSSSEGLLELLKDILEFSRSEILGESALQREHVNIRELAAGVINLHRPSAEAKGLEIRIEVSSEVPDYLLLDPARLRQILLNLVGNAVKFTDSGHVLVTLGRGGQACGEGKFPLRVAVRDTGIGIPVEKRHLLFQPFSQVDSGPTRRHGGTGLGLVICRRLAEVFGGAVYLEDSSSSGSTFVFECAFPVVGNPAPVHRNGTDKAWTDAWSPRILLAEDNAPSRKLLRAMLQSLGLACEEAVNGRHAVESHRSSPFEIIFMDLQMPEMDGIAATKAIRELEARGQPPPARIIALTADAMAGDRERCLAAGMDDYLSKPLRREDLVLALNRARERRAPAN
ncbi:MAG: ATP-binding protein, partial [Terrimicrobiaceae bacterium]|nr:ATP-binding protein [Terrimicrobiaceae bacterium]